jgi:hypothetical protein
VEYPNLTELYALPLQFGIFLLFVIALDKPDRKGYLFALGFLASTLLLLRQNIATPIVFGLAAMGYLWSTKSDTWLLWRLTSMGAGFLLGVGIPLGYFALKGSLGLMYEATVRFEFGFASTPLKDQVRSMFPCIKALNPVVLAAAGILFGAVSRLERESRFVKWLVVLSTIDFILGLALSSVPATGYLHYGISWTPALSVLSAYFGSVLLNYSNQSKFTLGYKQSLRAGSALVMCLIVATNLAFLTALIDRGIKPHGNQLTAALADFVRNSTRPSDQVFVWGAHAEINVLAGRSSCSRFFYHAALLQPRFFNYSVVGEIAKDLRNNRPELIIEPPPSQTVPPLDAGRREVFVREHREYERLCTALEPIFVAVSENYIQKDMPSLEPWVVYEPKHPVLK